MEDYLIMYSVVFQATIKSLNHDIQTFVATDKCLTQTPDMRMKTA
jgi:hypothetical protein